MGDIEGLEGVLIDNGDVVFPAKIRVGGEVVTERDDGGAGEGLGDSSGLADGCGDDLADGLSAGLAAG